MQQGTKLVCRKTLIHISKGKAYGRQGKAPKGPKNNILDYSKCFTGQCFSIRNFTNYIHTEKHSPKSYVVNFHTQLSSSQSEEQTMVFTREKEKKNDTSNKNRESFSACKKDDMTNQKPHRCVNFAPKFPRPPLIYALAACSATSQTFKAKSFSRSVFQVNSVKNMSEIGVEQFRLFCCR